MNKRRITLRDIAKELNVSVVTVSRALNNKPDISIETKQKVLDLVKKYNYRPNSIAKSLVQQKTNTIGVIVPEIHHSFFSEVVKGIEEIAFQSNYQIILACSNENEERQKKNLNTLLEKQVDGILISVAEDSSDIQPFVQLIEDGIPFVFFDRFLPEVKACRVVVDDVGGSEKAVEHLISLGYRRIGYVGRTKSVSIGIERFRGYKRALRRHGIPLDHDLVFESAFTEEAGYEVFLNRIYNMDGAMPEAIFAANDPIAIGIFRGVQEVGLEVPKDIALVGFSDLSIVSLLKTPLTTVYQPAYQLGAKAAAILIDSINTKTVKRPRRYILKTKLVVRESCGAKLQCNQ